MNRFRTSWTIFRHSFRVVRQHKTLVAFPLLEMFTIFATIAFFLMPLVFPMTIAEAWHGVWHPAETLLDLPNILHRYSDALRAHSTGVTAWDVTLGFAGFYVASLFATTFLNVAFFSQIIEALNGGRVSVHQGFAMAVARLPAIAAWTALSGTVGVIIRWFQSGFGVAGQWVMAMFGVSWSVASVFVAPVILHQTQVRNPLDYLKISASLIRRVWGEGIVGIGGGFLVGALISMLFGLVCGVVLVIGMGLDGSTYLPATVLAVVLFAFANQCVMTTIGKVFKGGLYIYATEGVAPGAFDEECLRNAWTVKKRMSQ